MFVGPLKHIIINDRLLLPNQSITHQNCGILFYKYEQEVFHRCLHISVPFHSPPMSVIRLTDLRLQTQTHSRVQTGAFDLFSSTCNVLGMKCFLPTLQANAITLRGVFSLHFTDIHPRLLM